MIAPRNHADVLVAGAGPAGAATALLLARAGVSVLLVDRHEFPRAKPCGDCLSAAAADVLQRLGVLRCVSALRPARLHGWRIVAPDGSAFTAHFRAAAGAVQAPDALALDRTLLDAALLEAAVAAGARFQPRTRVTDVIRNETGFVTGGITSRGEVRAHVTVGADGLRSVVATRLGAHRKRGTLLRRQPLRKLSLTFHLDAAVTSTPVGEMHVGDGVCAGIAPITEDLARSNVTVVADAERFGRRVAADPAGFAIAALESLPLLRGRIPAAALRRLTPLASGPFDRPARRIAFDGAVLTGDAAGYYDPFTGQGVYQALACAEPLAACIASALAQDDIGARAFAAFVARRAALLRGARLVQRGIELVLSRPALASRAIARIAHAHAFADALLHVTGDLRPAHSLLSPRALSSLLTLPHTPESSA